jgi:hypothetical protein
MNMDKCEGFRVQPIEYQGIVNKREDQPKFDQVNLDLGIHMNYTKYLPHALMATHRIGTYHDAQTIVSSTEHPFHDHKFVGLIDVSEIYLYSHPVKK